MYHNLLASLPEEHIRFTQLPNEKGHNAVWDFKRSPEGRFFLSLCCETDKPLSALLYEYYPKDGGLRLICDIQKEWIVHPDQMPPSKIHTSIDFLPDGQLIMATHNTAPARSHKRWAYEQHYEHIWEGFAGSIVMIVNPDTNDVKVKGIPVPRESIYGGLLGDDPRYYFFTGYMRGHFYRMDLETNEVRDYGKISEFGSFRLIKDYMGRIYGGTYTGELWRYDPKADAIQDLKVFFQTPYGTKNRRQLCHALKLRNGNLLFVSNLDTDMIELNPETLETVHHGYLHLRPRQPIKEARPMAGVGGFEIDENGILYYGLGTYHETDLMRLVRWDVFHGGEPENLGLISPHGKQSGAICEMLFDNEGILHMVDVCGLYSPYILAVDVKKIQPPGPDALKAIFKVVDMTCPAFNSDEMYFSFIDAERISALPLSRHIHWKDSGVKHMSRGTDGLMYAVCGGDDVMLAKFDFECQEPKAVIKIAANDSAVACIDGGEGCVTVITGNNKILSVDLAQGRCLKEAILPAWFPISQIHFATEDGRLLVSDEETRLAVLDAEALTLELLENVRLQDKEACAVRLPGDNMLLSGYGDELLKYNLNDRQAFPLAIKSASIRGRAFKATVSGGLLMEDGSVVCGTLDGMLYRIAPGLKGTFSCGRMHSSGRLRSFIKYGSNMVLGIYGGNDDSGHVFTFSPANGFVDLGRPRVNKEDSGKLQYSSSDWANIHEISCINYDPKYNRLYVASGEQYGCIIRYENI